MQNVSIFVFLPLTVCLMVLAFNEKLRGRLLGIQWIADAERKFAKLDKFYWGFFALVMAAGFFVRCYRFIELPKGINQDGLMAGVEAYCLAMNGTDQFGTSWPTYFEAWGFSQMSTLYSYLLIPFIRVIGLSKMTLRLPMLLISLAAMPLIWDFARRIAGKRFALLALLVIALNPWHVIQSRWMLEANLMPHVLLLAVYLLYLGRENRCALYASMVFFGLTPYAYGLACFSAPLFLACAAAYYAARKKVKAWDILICIAIFAVVAGPYFYTMMINAFGWETANLGPITMPLFEDSLRKQDMVFGKENPYYELIQNLFEHLGTWLFPRSYSWYNVIPWAHAFYLFMIPVLVWGLYLMWRDRRDAAGRNEDNGFRDGAMLLLLWIGAAVFNGMMIGGVVNRNNVVYYPLIIVAAYVLYQMGRRVRTVLVPMILVLFIGFAGLNVTYFTDETYQNGVGNYFGDGLYEALTDTWDWDYDYYYVNMVGGEDGAHAKLIRAYVMFAHQIDYAARNEDVLLRGPDGQEIDWYFGERYIFKNMTTHEMDPMECAVYIVPESMAAEYDPQDYLISKYGLYAAVYPRYWAE